MRNRKQEKEKERKRVTRSASWSRKTIYTHTTHIQTDRAKAKTEAAEAMSSLGKRPIDRYQRPIKRNNNSAIAKRRRRKGKRKKESAEAGQNKAVVRHLVLI